MAKIIQHPSSKNRQADDTFIKYLTERDRKRADRVFKKYREKLAKKISDHKNNVK